MEVFFCRFIAYQILKTPYFLSVSFSDWSQVENPLKMERRNFKSRRISFRNCFVFAFLAFSLSSSESYGLTLDSNGSLAASPPFAQWLENWGSHKENLSLVYSDDDIAFYFDPEVSRSITWPFKLLSKTWKYMKEQYEPLSISIHDQGLSFDPTEFKDTTSRLHVIMHTNKHEGCRNVILKSNISLSMKIIDCGLVTRDPWAKEVPSNNLDSFLQQVALLVLKLKTAATLSEAFFRQESQVSQETWKWPAFEISRWKIVDIIVYDIYTHLGLTWESWDARRWGKEREDEIVDYPQNGTAWFKNWFLPIYTQYGGNSVLKRFLQILSTHLSHNIGTTLNSRYGNQTLTGKNIIDEQLNVGQFVYFWRRAVGANLRTRAFEAFNWTREYKNQFNEARQQFQKSNLSTSSLIMPSSNVKQDSEIDSEADDDLGGEAGIRNDNASFPPRFLKEQWMAHDATLALAYHDDNVRIYFDTTVSSELTWPFQLLSTSWGLMKSLYTRLRLGQVSTNYLYMFLHSSNASDYDICFMVHKKRISVPTGRPTSTEVDTTMKTETSSGLDLQYALDCTFNSSQVLVNETSDNVDLLLSDLALILQKDTVHNITRAFKYSGMRKVSSIMTFDLLLNLGRIHDAYRYLNSKYIGNRVTAGKDKYWVKDWYLPIYTEYGGAIVFDRFANIIPKFKSLKGRVEVDINYGEYFHFWCGAAQWNLRDLAVQVFGWDAGNQNQFERARTNFPLNYSCVDCDKLPKVPEEKDFKVDDSSSSLVVGLSVGAVLVVLIMFLFPLLFYVNRLRREVRELTNEEVSQFFEGNAKLDKSEANGEIQSKPFDMSYELPLERLRIDHDKVLGCGEFGIVMKGSVKSLSRPGEGNENLGVKNIDVAVKTVKPNVEVSYFKALLSELKILSHLGNHSNVACLLGAYTVNIRNREVFVALEFCGNGDLLHFLKKCRRNFSNLFENKEANINVGCTAISSTSDDNPIPTETDDSNLNAYNKDELAEDGSEFVKISTLNLVKWARQVADGMSFIGGKNVIHGDLAARNVLLTGDHVAKISDFGLSRQLVNYSNYMKTSKTPVPWRWMAIESLSDMNFSIQSDVWAYGVTLWEIFSLGMTPYAGWTWDYQFLDKLSAGERLQQPQFANSEITDLMLNCWKKEPSQRISFQKLSVLLAKLEAKLVDPNQPMNHMCESMEESSNYLRI